MRKAVQCPKCHATLEVNRGLLGKQLVVPLVATVLYLIAWYWDSKSHWLSVDSTIAVIVVFVALWAYAAYRAWFCIPLQIKGRRN